MLRAGAVAVGGGYRHGMAYLGVGKDLLQVDVQAHLDGDLEAVGQRAITVAARWRESVWEGRLEAGAGV